MINGQNFTIVDTPGFGDSDGQDSKLIDKMVRTLKDDVKTTNGFLLLFNGQQARFDSLLQQMLRDLQIMFGENVWNHVMIGFTHWPYDSKSAKRRNKR